MQLHYINEYYSLIPTFQVFSVGVGSGVDMSELNAMATDPDSSHVLTVQDFSQLQQITASLNSQACQGWFGLIIPCSAGTSLGQALPSMQMRSVPSGQIQH